MNRASSSIDPIGLSSRRIFKYGRAGDEYITIIHDVGMLTRRLRAAILVVDWAVVYNTYGYICKRMEWVVTKIEICSQTWHSEARSSLQRSFNGRNSKMTKLRLPATALMLGACSVTDTRTNRQTLTDTIPQSRHTAAKYFKSHAARSLCQPRWRFVFLFKVSRLLIGINIPLWKTLTKSTSRRSWCRWRRALWRVLPLLRS